MLFNALLMIDIVNKIKTLGAVLSIFSDNSTALLSTLALFGVLLYIAAFISFRTFRTDFTHFMADDPDDAPDFNMYCESLIECFVTTLGIGLR